MLAWLKGRARFLLNVILLVGGVGLLVTTVRATYAATALSLLLVAMISRSYTLILKVALVGMIAGIVLQTSAQVRLGERIASSLDPQDTSRQAREEETQQKSLPFVLQHPFGGGTGIMSAGASAAVWGDETVFLALPYGIVHNNFMLVAMEIGWLGLAAWVWLVLTIILTAFQIFKTARDGLVRHLALGVFGVAVYYLAMHPFQRMLNAAQQPVMFWTLVGLLPVLPLLDSSTPESDDADAATTK